MRCLRCGGWMVQDHFMDLKDDTGRLYCEGWRCVNCGDLLDPVILQHEARALAEASTDALS